MHREASARSCRMTPYNANIQGDRNEAMHARQYIRSVEWCRVHTSARCTRVDLRSMKSKPQYLVCFGGCGFACDVMNEWLSPRQSSVATSSESGRRKTNSTASHILLQRG
jgi:hypothetical protein